MIDLDRCTERRTVPMWSGLVLAYWRPERVAFSLAHCLWISCCDMTRCIHVFSLCRIDVCLLAPQF